MEIFDYDNILLLPRKCRVQSRSECDTSVTLGKYTFRLPVVPANMKTVVNESICEWLASNGYFYVMHRFDLDNLKFVRDCKTKVMYASVSLGVKQADYDKITLQEEISVIGYLCDQEEGTKIITKGNNVFDINAQGWNAFSK